MLIGRCIECGTPAVDFTCLACREDVDLACTGAHKDRCGRPEAEESPQDEPEFKGGYYDRNRPGNRS